MKIVDVNILLYAINRSVPHHTLVRRWWEHSLSSSEPIGLAWPTIVGFVRLATHRKIFPQPQTLGEALKKVNDWLDHPNTSLVTESKDHWKILQQLLLETGTAGNLTSDAQLAALAISRGATLVSCDKDFNRFEQLRWENPLA